MANDVITLSSDRKLPNSDDEPVEEMGDCSVTKEGERAKAREMDGEHELLHGVDSEVEGGGLCMGVLSPEAYVGRKALRSGLMMGEVRSSVRPLNVVGPIGVLEESEQAEQVEGTIVRETNEMEMCPAIRPNACSRWADLVLVLRNESHDPLSGQRMGRVEEGDFDPSRALCVVEEGSLSDPQEYTAVEEEILNNPRMLKRGRSRQGKKRRNIVKVYGEVLPSAMEVTDYSLSDNDIARRTAACKREASAICEVSSRIGLVYDCDGVEATKQILLKKGRGRPLAA